MQPRDGITKIESDETELALLYKPCIPCAVPPSQRLS